VQQKLSALVTSKNASHLHQSL